MLNFIPKQDITLDATPKAIALADFNGDGLPDLASALQDQNNLAIFLNTTPPNVTTFAFAPKQDITISKSANNIVSADFNVDGKPDLITSDDGISILVNTTPIGALTAAFVPNQDFNFLGTPYAIATADFNGDKIPDLVTANKANNTISILLNNTGIGAPNVTFARSFNLTVGLQPSAVVTGDFNLDGQIDIAVLNQGNKNISLLLNTTPLGSFRPNFFGAIIDPNTPNLWSIGTADFNQDGKIDLITNNQQNPTVNSTSVYINNTPAGSNTVFFNPTSPIASSQYQNFVSSDFNLDNFNDLAAVGSNISDIALFLNSTPNGAANLLNPPQTIFTDGNNNAIVTGDFNRDNRPDIAVSNPNSKSLSLLANETVSIPQPPAPPPASFLPSLNLPITGAPIDIGSADFNKDGKLDLAMIFANNPSVLVLTNTTPVGVNNPNPTFATPVITPLRFIPTSLDLGDVNNDQLPDLITTQNGGNQASNVAAVLLNTTNFNNPIPTFNTQQDLPQNFAPFGYTDIAADDLNNDGKIDVAVSNGYGSEKISLFQNNTIERNSVINFISSPDVGVSLNPDLIDHADLNNDGKLDLIVSDSQLPIIEILVNTSSNGANPTYAFALDLNIKTDSFSFADFNLDGNLDLVANRGNNIAVFFNTTPPDSTEISFGTILDFPATGIVDTGDFNGDKRPDIAVANPNTGKITILTNNTATGASIPAFIAQPDLTVSGQITALLSDDLNGDKQPDLVGGNPSGIGILTNNTQVINVIPDSLFVEGTKDNDNMLGTALNDNINGFGGNDTITGFEGNDLLIGAADNDVIYGNGNADTLNGEVGNDSLYGGKGQDVISGDAPTDSIGGNDLIYGNDDSDQLFGGVGNDSILGGKQDDVINGQDGNDTLSGDLGNDLLTGGAGNDVFLLNANSNVDLIGSGDTISDFTDDVDLIAIDQSLSQSISITSNGPITTISANNIVLANVAISANLITDQDFIFL